MESPQLNLQVPEPLLNARQVAEVLNVSKALAYKLMKQGKIPSVRIEGARRVQMKDLQSFINLNRASNR